MPVSEHLVMEEMLRQLGFKKSIKDVRMFIKAKSFEFSIAESKVVGNDTLMYQLEFEGEGNETRLKKYELTLQSVIIPKMTIEGINTAKLEKRLVKADKLYNDYYSEDKPLTKEETEVIESSNKDIHQLFDAGGTAKEIAQLLMFKYWPEENYKQYIPFMDRLKENYQAELTVNWNNGNILSAEEAYQKAKQQFHVSKL
ncbi:MAG TPA: hypothetical protein PKM40_00400, partial [Bacteroidia bacterium]|nr:hypothetical protein [Bacteroidia bacterium]